MRNRWHKQVCLYWAVEKRDKIQARVSKGLIMLKILVGGRKKLKKKMLFESGKKYLTVNLFAATSCHLQTVCPLAELTVRLVTPNYYG